MQKRRLIALAAQAVLIPGNGFGMYLEKAQQPTIKRTELRRHDLSVSGREIVQARIEFGPGMAFGRHTHPGEEVVYVLEGSLEFQVDGKLPVTLRAGDVLFVPAQTTHTAKNVGTTTGAELAHVCRRKREADRCAGSVIPRADTATTSRRRRRSQCFHQAHQSRSRLSG